MSNIVFINTKYAYSYNYMLQKKQVLASEKQLWNLSSLLIPLRTLGTISTVYNKIILGRKSGTFENQKYVICSKMIVSYTAKAIFKAKGLTSPIFC